MLVDMRIPREKNFAERSMMWFAAWWVINRTDVHGNVGLMRGSTIKSNMSKVVALHALRPFDVDLEGLRPTVNALAKGHDLQTIDRVGVRAIRKRAEISNDLLKQMYEIGWSWAVEQAFAGLASETVQELACILLIVSALAAMFGYRGASLMQTDSRQPFHPHWNLVRASATYRYLDGGQVPDSDKGYQQFIEEGGTVRIEHTPNKGDPDGSRYAHLPHYAEHRPGGAGALPAHANVALLLAQQEIRRPCHGPARMTTPMIADPRNGKWLQKTVFMRVFYILLVQVFDVCLGTKIAMSVVKLAYGFHSYRVAFKCNMEAIRAPAAITNGIGQWVENSKAAGGYSRAQLTEVLEFFAKASVVKTGSTLPLKLKELETAIRRSAEDEAIEEGGEVRVAAAMQDTQASARMVVTRPRPPPPPPPGQRPQLPLEHENDTWLTRAYAAHTEADGQQRQTAEADDEVEEKATPALPSYLIGRRILLSSLDTSQPLETRAYLSPGKPTYDGTVISLHQADEGEGEAYMAIVVFPDHTYPNSEVVLSEEIGVSAFKEVLAEQ